jgi:hypothetical protein
MKPPNTVLSNKLMINLEKTPVIPSQMLNLRLISVSVPGLIQDLLVKTVTMDSSLKKGKAQ